jgi:hypothetical protein
MESFVDQVRPGLFKLYYRHNNWKWSLEFSLTYLQKLNDSRVFECIFAAPELYLHSEN